MGAHRVLSRAFTASSTQQSICNSLGCVPPTCVALPSHRDAVSSSSPSLHRRAHTRATKRAHVRGCARTFTRILTRTRTGSTHTALVIRQRSPLKSTLAYEFVHHAKSLET
eukprot:1886010-Pleurochrysis_carterae.AAC.1